MDKAGYSLLKNNLPDGRGVFIRGMNDLRNDGAIDPYAAENGNTPRPVGVLETIQADFRDAEECFALCIYQDF
jgi:hypothetical protein